MYRTIYSLYVSHSYYIFFHMIYILYDVQFVKAFTAGFLALRANAESLIANLQVYITYILHYIYYTYTIYLHNNLTTSSRIYI